MDPTAGSFNRIHGSRDGGPSSSVVHNHKSPSYIMEDPVALRMSSLARRSNSRNTTMMSSVIMRKSSVTQRVSYVVDVRHSGMDATRISQASRPLLDNDDDDGSTTSSSNNKSTGRKKKNQISKIENIIPILPIEIALFRFASIVILGWILLYIMMFYNAQFFVEELIPASFWFFHYMVIIGIIGGGYPFVAPLGFQVFQAYWSGHFRLVLGVLQTSIVVALSYLMNKLFVNYILKYPLFGGGAFFGIGLFTVTLWWVFNVMTAPSPPTFGLYCEANFAVLGTPLFKIILHSTICVLLGIGLFQFVDLDEDAAEKLKGDPNGPIKSTTWFNILGSIIVWVQIFSSTMVFQGWPFAKIRPPLNHFVTLIVVVGLGTFTYFAFTQWTKLISEDLFGAIGGSQISWSLYHALAFDHWPYHKLVQPKRGYYNFVTNQIILTTIWIWICHIILGPIYHLMLKANPTLYSQLFTINTMVPWFSLHIVAALLIIHHLFFMRWPFPPGGPPLGPFDIGIIQDHLLELDDEYDDDDNDDGHNSNNHEDLSLILEDEENENDEPTARDITGYDNNDDDNNDEAATAEEGRGLLMSRRQRESKELAAAGVPGSGTRGLSSDKRLRDSTGLNPLSSGI